MAKHSGECNFMPAKRGNFLVCSRGDCGERFPCAERSCGHLDCIEERTKTSGLGPVCHFCTKATTGPRGEDWGVGLVHGKTRAFHYECRDSQQQNEDAA